jgi:hypothetical protein
LYVELIFFVFLPSFCLHRRGSVVGRALERHSTRPQPLITTLQLATNFQKAFTTLVFFLLFGWLGQHVSGNWHDGVYKTTLKTLEGVLCVSVNNAWNECLTAWGIKYQSTERRFSQVIDNYPTSEYIGAYICFRCRPAADGQTTCEVGPECRCSQASLANRVASAASFFTVLVF